MVGLDGTALTNPAASFAFFVRPVRRDDVFGHRRITIHYARISAGTDRLKDRPSLLGPGGPHTKLANCALFQGFSRNVFNWTKM